MEMEKSECVSGEGGEVRDGPTEVSGSEIPKCGGLIPRCVTVPQKPCFLQMRAD